MVLFVWLLSQLGIVWDSVRAAKPVIEGLLHAIDTYIDLSCFGLIPTPAERGADNGITSRPRVAQLKVSHAHSEEARVRCLWFARYN